jgi:S1-C subfamily serine protease
MILARRSALLSCCLVIAAFTAAARSAESPAPSAGKDATAVTPPAPASAVQPAAPEDKGGVVENAVVKIFATTRLPDLYKPWTKQAPQEISGSGLVIEGKRILTNAHVVLYASQVQIQAYQAGDKISASVEMVAPGIDLAVLKLDDETFFDTHPPLPRASALPKIKDPVLVYGYPTGGTSLSITKGIVSRIEFTSYNFPTGGLRIQIDAAINPGNSGGPAVAGDKVVGLAFSHLSNAENIGYIIPTEEIELFLKDAADGHYDGKPAMFDALQTFENPALRPFLKVDKSVEGMIVTRADNPDPAYPLKPWDIITHIGDTPIDNQGMIKIEDNLRVRFQYLIQKLARDGRVPLTITRNGQERKIELPVAPRRPMVLTGLEGGYPSYFIFGPLAFSAATQEFIYGYNSNGAQAAFAYIGSPLATRRGDRPAEDGEQLVVVTSPFFPHKLSKGYGNTMSSVVKSVNGKAVKNLSHLVTLLRDSRDEFVVFEFAGRGAETIVLPRQECLAATEDILVDNGVRSQGSPDMIEVWKAKPAK